jgi:transcriptional regulator with XRE-family HTH domain
MDGKFYDHNFLKKVRSAKHTQEDFAEQLGINTITLSRLENGRGGSYDLIIRVCRALDLDSAKVFYSSRDIELAEVAK